jgi:hypothetical protein
MQTSAVNDAIKSPPRRRLVCPYYGIRVARPCILVSELRALSRAFCIASERKLNFMKPMFLPDIEANPQPSPYADMIRLMQSNSADYPQIWHLFAFKPETTAHLAKFTQEILREPGPLTPGFRELIAAYTSARNDCPF